MLEKKLSTSKLLAKNAAINAGLQGITMAPKKNPNKNAFVIGFLAPGVFILGINLLKSKLKIKNMLMIPKIPNAMGEIIEITFVRDSWRIVVNIRPRAIIKARTPATTNRPNKIIAFLFSSPDSLFERKERKAG